MERWTQPLKPLLDLFLESPCPLCQRSTAQEFCQACRHQVQRCQLPNPQTFWHDSLPLFVWGTYSGSLKQAIATLKYENQPQIARPLGHWLARAWLENPPIATQRPIVVPIPMHPSKQKIRGFNQAELLATAFCEMTGLALKRNGLNRVRATEAQFTLSKANREHNLKSAFQVDKALLQSKPSTPILLFDDIYTTGATARAAAQTLQDQQIEVVGLAAIAMPSFNRT